jgi:hypothetical protein
MLHKTKKMLHEKIWLSPHAPWYKNTQVQKKLTKVMNLLQALSFNKGGRRKEEEEIPSPSPPSITTTTTTTMNRYRPSPYYQENNHKK